MDCEIPQRQERVDDCRSITTRILHAVAAVLQDRADRWLKADKSNDNGGTPISYIPVPRRVLRHDKDLKQNNFYGALKLAGEKSTGPSRGSTIRRWSCFRKDLMGQSICLGSSPGTRLNWTPTRGVYPK